MRRTKSNSSYTNNSRNNIDQYQLDSAEDVDSISFDFSSSRTSENISEDKWYTAELSSIALTNNSVGIKKDIPVGSNPASYSTLTLYLKLTVD